MPKRYGEDGPSLYVNIGREIMVARRRALLNQRELGERLGVSHAAISDIERGKSKPNLDGLAEIARALGVPLRQIVHLGRPRPPATNVGGYVSRAEAERIVLDMMTPLESTSGPAPADTED